MLHKDMLVWYAVAQYLKRVQPPTDSVHWLPCQTYRRAEEDRKPHFLAVGCALDLAVHHRAFSSLGVCIPVCRRRSCVIVSTRESYDNLKPLQQIKENCVEEQVGGVGGYHGTLVGLHPGK